MIFEHFQRLFNRGAGVFVSQPFNQIRPQPDRESFFSLVRRESFSPGGFSFAAASHQDISLMSLMSPVVDPSRLIPAQ